MHIKENNNSPHGKFHRFLFPFSSKFPDLNFAPHVLYIYSCYMNPVRDTNSEPGGAIHSTKISGNFGPKLNGSVRSNRKRFEKTGPPFDADHFSRSDRLEFWLNGSRPGLPVVLPVA